MSGWNFMVCKLATVYLLPYLSACQKYPWDTSAHKLDLSAPETKRLLKIPEYRPELTTCPISAEGKNPYSEPVWTFPKMKKPIEAFFLLYGFFPWADIGQVVYWFTCTLHCACTPAALGHLEHHLLLLVQLECETVWLSGMSLRPSQLVRRKQAKEGMGAVFWCDLF